MAREMGHWQNSKWAFGERKDEKALKKKKK